jgi:hypothetical protein
MTKFLPQGRVGSEKTIVGAVKLEEDNTKK